MNDSDTKDPVVACPPPLIPSDVDLRDFRFMPLDVVQLQNSETWAMADGWAAKALLNLWTKAWHQVPSGSLPDNDDLHRTWANVPGWELVRDVALRGFIKCNDGRLYHRIICQKALDAWNERKRFRRAAKARWKNKKTKDATRMQWTSNAHATHGQQQHPAHVQGTGTGTGTGTKRKDAAGAAPAVEISEEAELFRRGKAVLGHSAGGLHQEPNHGEGRQHRNGKGRNRNRINQARPTRIHRRLHPRARGRRAFERLGPRAMTGAAEILSANRIAVRSTNEGRYYTTCPECSHKRKASHRRLKCLGVTIDREGVMWGCNHCGWKGGGRFHENSRSDWHRSYRTPQHQRGNGRSLRDLYR
jgi:uncharacterized protein YdaU (DUF1376 family)